MRTSLFLALSLIPVLAYATDTSSTHGVELEQQKVSGQSITGRCGASTVKVSGLDGDPTSSPISPNAAITIAAGKSVLTISPESNTHSGIFLQDRNQLHCLSTPQGSKLVLAMECDGRSCARVDYRVIDPKTTKVVSGQDASEECDSECAQKALGVPLPAALVEL